MQLLKIFDNNTTLLALLVIVFLLYFVTNRSLGQTHIVRIGLDNNIPLIPAFSIPYLLFLPAFAGTIIYAYATNARFKALAASVIVVYLLSYAVYALYQTYVPRPVVNGHDVLSSLVRWIYTHDQPYNGVPSTHASAATILAVYYLTTHARIGWLIAVFSLIVILSTLFVKQHFLLDALAGVVLGASISLMMFRYLAN